MKTAFFFVTFLFLSLSFAVKPVVGGRAPVKKLEINCEFPDIENQYLDATAYAPSASGDVTFAEVTVYKQVDDKKSVLKRYHLNYIADQGVSFYFKFADGKNEVRLEAMTDDMGRMSSLKVKDESFDLTCSEAL